MMTVIERGQEVDYEWRHLIPNNCFLKFYPIPNRLKEFCAKERFILFKFYYFQNLKKFFRYCLHERKKFYEAIDKSKATGSSVEVYILI